MDYQYHYEQLCKTRQTLPRQKGQGEYYEQHHIIPVCMGGTHDSTNLVLLTAREHYIAHWLLWKIHRTSQMAYAFAMMAKGKAKRKLTSCQYERCRVAVSEANSVSKMGNKYWLGRKHSEATKAKMSAKHKLYRASEATKAKQSKQRKGVPKSKEHKNSIARSLTKHYKADPLKVAKFCESHTHKEACKEFGISMKTISNYKRIAKNPMFGTQGEDYTVWPNISQL